MLAAQMHKPLLKKYFCEKNIFLKSAGKMPISLKVQGKCLYYPSGDLKIVFGRPDEEGSLDMPVVSVFRKKCQMKMNHTVLQCLYHYPPGFVNTSPASNV